MLARFRPSPAMVVAIAALVAALAGTAFAATLIDGSSIKKRSIAGNRLKDHTLTGRQIKLAKLGTVPNAARLGGAPPSAYVPAGKLLRWNLTMNKGQAAKVIGSLGPLKLTASCKADGGNTDAAVLATTTESGLFITTAPESQPSGPSTTLNTNSTPYPIVEQDTAVANDGNSNALAAFDPGRRVAVFSTAQTFGVAINTPGADCRFFGYLINDA